MLCPDAVPPPAPGATSVTALRLSPAHLPPGTVSLMALWRVFDYGVPEAQGRRSIIPKLGLHLVSLLAILKLDRQLAPTAATHVPPATAIILITIQSFRPWPQQQLRTPSCGQRPTAAAQRRGWPPWGLGKGRTVVRPEPREQEVGTGLWNEKVEGSGAAPPSAGTPPCWQSQGPGHQLCHLSLGSP